MDTKKPFLNKRVYIRGPEWDAVANAVRRAMRLTAELNKLSFDDDAKVRELFGELIGQKVDETFKLIPPFYTEGGLNIRVGHKVFINQCCTIYDMGGVERTASMRPKSNRRLTRIDADKLLENRLRDCITLHLRA
jgi:hypothetical protein